MIHWFVIWSARNAEFTAADALHDLGFSVYLPKETDWCRQGVRKGADAKRTVDRPLFRRYLFAGYEDGENADERRNKMRYAEGVEHILGKLTEQGKDRLYQLKAEQAKGEFDLTIDRTPKLELGQLVSLEIEGREVFGEVIHLTPEQRVEVLLINFLGKVTAVRNRAEVRAA